MKEESELFDFIRGRLEGDVPVDPPRFGAIMHAAAEAASARAAARRSRRRLWGSLLAAASLAVLLSVSVARLQTGSPAPDETITEVIDLLRTEGDVDSVSNDASAVERLLAWQDAPYESAIDGLSAEN